MTLDDDLVTLLAQVRRQGQGSFNDVVNKALGLGLIAMTKPREPFRTGTLSNGPRNLSDIDCLGKTLAWAEGEDYK